VWRRHKSVHEVFNYKEIVAAARAVSARHLPESVSDDHDNVELLSDEDMAHLNAMEPLPDEPAAEEDPSEDAEDMDDYLFSTFFIANSQFFSSSYLLTLNVFYAYCPFSYVLTLIVTLTQTLNSTIPKKILVLTWICVFRAFPPSSLPLLEPLA